ncbi:MAG: hypothetical protein JWQ98_3491 [Chlorobi bacterium]|nr:hypothetical protein [Chlorobiota bacterium]
MVRGISVEGEHQIRVQSPGETGNYKGNSMLKRDYILSMVEHLAQFIARVVFLRETNRGDSAIAEIDEFYQKVFEHDARTIRTMPHQDVVALCVSDGLLDHQRSVALASVLKEEGDILALQGYMEGAGDCYTRSLVLLLATYGAGTEALPLGTVQTLELVVDRALGHEMPAAVTLDLLHYFEGNGLYADAENLLYELIDDGTPGAAEEGVAFYQRLLRKDDQDLADGDLPRAEVEEGLAALLKGG